MATGSAGQPTAGGWNSLNRAKDPQRWRVLGLGLPGAVLGVLFLAETPPPASTGAALLADWLCAMAALVAVVGDVAVLLLPATRAAWAAVVGAAASATLAGAVLLTATSPASPARSWVVALSLLVLVSSAIAVRLVHFRWAAIKKQATKTTVGILTVIAVPVFTFWQATTYLPSQSKVALTVAMSTTAVEASDGTSHWRIGGTVTNVSNVRAFTVISYLRACQWRDEAEVADTSSDPRASSHCLTLRRPVGRGWIDPKSELEFSDSLAVDPERPLLRLDFGIAYGRGDRVREVAAPQRPASRSEAGSCSDVWVVALQDTSRLRAFTLERTHLMFGDTNGDGGVNYFFAPADHLQCPLDLEQSYNDYFALTELHASSDSWRTAPPPASGSGSASDTQGS